MTYETKSIPNDNFGRVVDRLEARRVSWPTNKPLVTMMRYEHAEENNRIKVLTWIDQHTTSRFYVAGSHIGFEDPRELTMFKLGWKP